MDRGLAGLDGDEDESPCHRMVALMGVAEAELAELRFISTCRTLNGLRAGVRLFHLSWLILSWTYSSPYP